MVASMFTWITIAYVPFCKVLTECVKYKGLTLRKDKGFSVISTWFVVRGGEGSQFFVSSTSNFCSNFIFAFKTVLVFLATVLAFVVTKFTRFEALTFALR